MKPSRSPVVNIDDFSQGMHAMAYDATLGNVLFGSMNSNGVFGISGRAVGEMENDAILSNLGVNDITQYFTSNTDACTQIIDMVVDPHNRCNLWMLCPSAAMDTNGEWQYATGTTHLGMIDLCTQTLDAQVLTRSIRLQYFDDNAIVPTSFTIRTEQNDHDILIVSNNANGQTIILQVDNIYDPTHEADDFTVVPGDFGSNAAGIETFMGQLIVGAPDGIRIKNLDDDNSPVTTLLAGANPVGNAYSLHFNSDKSFLFMTKSTTSVSEPSEVLALTSTDGWRTNAGVSARIQIDCNRAGSFNTVAPKTDQDFTSRVVSIPAANHASLTSPWGENLVMLCAAYGFRMSSATNNRIDMHVIDQYMPTLSNQFDANTDTIPVVCTDDDDDDDDSALIAASVLAGFFGVTTIGLLGYMYYSGKSKPAPSLNTHPSSNL